MDVVVLNCWVTETNHTSCVSNSSTSFAKSARSAGFDVGVLVSAETFFGLEAILG